MSRVLSYDEATSRRVEAIYKTQAMAAQRRHVLRLLAPRPGEHILDVGCGPGYLAGELAARVGPTGSVYGIDVSEHMLAIAEAHAERAAPDTPIELHRANATALPSEEGTFDAAVATQVYEFVNDTASALAELYRVLRPGGRALILDTDWDSVVWHSSDGARMRRVLHAWQGRLANPHLPRTLSPTLRQAGFEISHREAFPIFDPEGEETTYSALQIDHIAAAAVGGNEVSTGEVCAWAADLRTLARSDSYFFSVSRYIFLATKATPG